MGELTTNQPVAQQVREQHTAAPTEEGIDFSILPKGLEIRMIGDIRSADEIEFGPIAEKIGLEPDMLHPTSQALKNSFEEGLAVIATYNGTIIGYLRFTPLLDGALKEKLGLPNDFPSIWETSSAWVPEEYRGGKNGVDLKVYTRMRYALIKSQSNALSSGVLLVMGTTKHIAVIRGVRSSAVPLGLNFEFSNHLKYPFVAAFTCVCTGKLGAGMHSTLDCSKRANDEEIVEIMRKANTKRPKTFEDGELKVINGSNENNGFIRCTMYVSSSELTTLIDERLRERFHDPMLLSRELVKLGYY